MRKDGEREEVEEGEKVEKGRIRKRSRKNGRKEKKMETWEDEEGRKRRNEINWSRKDGRMEEEEKKNRKKKKRGRKKEKEEEKEKGMKLEFWNVAGIKGKGGDFWERVKKWDVVGLVETWMVGKEWERIKRKLPSGYS